MYLDGSYVGTRFPQNVQLDDNVELRLGTNQDLRLKHSGTAGTITNYVGNLTISNTQDDGDIIFKSDNGSGGTATYLTIDGGDENIQFSKDGKFLDNVKAIFGNSNDLQIYHDGNNSKITEGGTGGLYIGSSLLGIQNNDHTEMMAQFTENGAVELYYDNSKKFETTTGGVSVTGSLSVSTTSSLVGDVSIGDTNSAFIGMLRAGANYIAATNAAGYLIFRTGGTTPTLTLGVNHDVRFDEYGSGTNSGTEAYNLAVDSSGNVIETPSSGGGSGGGTGKGGHYSKVYTTGNAGAAGVAFTIDRATTGSMVFDVMFTSDTSTACAVAKKYTVACTYGATAPIYNKILDTGPDGSNDFTVAFADDTSNTKIKCTITPTGLGTQKIGISIWLGYGENNATVVMN